MEFDRSGFYQASAALTLLIQQSKMLLGTHAVRYRYIVDNSDRGLGCPYADGTWRQHQADPEEIQLLLTQIQEQAATCSELLRAQEKHETENSE